MTRRYAALLWLLSGLPVGLALIFLPASVALWCFVLFVFLETGHSLSPIVLAWTHREFRRRVIYPQPYKFLLLPGLISGVAVVIGVATQAGWTSYSPGPGASGRITGWDNPFPLLLWFYSAWNLYHFAMQDYGVWRLWRKNNGSRQGADYYNHDLNVFGGVGVSASFGCATGTEERSGVLGGRRNPSNIHGVVSLGYLERWASRSKESGARLAKITRLSQKTICLVGLLGLYFAVGGINVLGFWQHPGLIQAWWIPLAMVGVVSVNHWVVDIGLSCRVAKRGWVFVIGVLSVGAIGFVWMVPTSHGMMIRMIPAIVCARLGLGFVHFLYSRWVWQFSDPQVRATIGRDLFAARSA